MYDPVTNAEVASASLAGYGPGAFAMDPVYPQYNGFNTVVQVDTGGSQQVTRWGLPPRPTWPAPLVNLGSSTVPIPVNYGIIVDNNGDLIGCDIFAGVTNIVRYRLIGGVWTLQERTALAPGNVVLDISRVTMDCAAVFWIAGFWSGLPTTLRIWRWTPGTTPQLFFNTQVLSGGEVPSWIAAERPCSGGCSPQFGGYLYVSCKLPTIPQDGTNTWVFNPGSPPGASGSAVGGNQVWPDTTLGSTGRGMYVDSRQVTNPPHQIGYFLRLGCGSCGTSTSILTTRQPTAHQIYFDPVTGPRPVVATTDKSSPSFVSWFRAYLSGSCAAGPLFQYEAQGMSTEELSVLGYGWNYVEYTMTGTVVRF